MSFQSTMLLGVVLLGVALLVVMLYFTTPPTRHGGIHHCEEIINFIINLREESIKLILIFIKRAKFLAGHLF
jgi:hypothetical protein